MKLPIINKNTENYSKEILAKSYTNDFIPAEKKNYLTDLKKSTGPFLAITDENDETKYLMDAASQIATLGLGFSPSVFFGTAQFLESWTNDANSSEFQILRSAFTNTLKRKLDWKELDLTICNSGAEANEIALGYCYKKRVNPKANKVLAFEGSFHGRMMITLSSTWNKVKREPFEWPGHETTYCSFPELDTDQINLSAPSEWRTIWAKSSILDLDIPNEWSIDAQVKKEVDSLLEVRSRLQQGDIFAVIVEPMQCEGGDRYSSARFNEGLILLAHSFNVPVVYDEVQTGFHLGKEFFWHKEFNLKNDIGEEISPDYVVCAKKAQVGLVLSKESHSKKEQFQVSSVIRGYLHAVALDQSQELIQNLETTSRQLLNNLCEKFPGKITRPRANGMAFAFELPDAQTTTEFINKRFDHGLLYYPAGAKTLRFRLNTSFTKEDIEYLFNRIEVMSEEIFNKNKIVDINSIETKDRSNDLIYEWQELLLTTKLRLFNNEKLPKKDFLTTVQRLFKKSSGHELIQIDENNFKDWKDEVQQMQFDIYEPARQTEIEKFEQCAVSEKGVAIAVVDGSSLLAMSFSSQLELNPFERGVRNDPGFNNPNVLYMVDSTVGKKIQGKGIGRYIKYALTAIAMIDGIERINGRNRDRMAASMLNINLSLGAHEIMYMSEDYPDFEKYRDVIYYSCPTTFKKDSLILSDAINSPLGSSDLTTEFMTEQLPYLVNKVCLSNFVSPRFLGDLSKIQNLLPAQLQHAYTTSGQSECVDKLAKSIWFNQKEKTNHMITFNGHYFGEGSFLSRSLSINDDKFFNVTHLDHPTEENIDQILESLKSILESTKTMAIWIEPISQNSMKKVSKDILVKIMSVAKENNTKVVFNETASGFYRFSNENFFASNDPEIMPDAAMAFLGGQAGLCFMKSENFLPKPLMLISTWDGDEFSFSNSTKAIDNICDNLDNFFKIRLDFTNKLSNLLEEYQISEMEIENGCGYFIGNISVQLKRYFLVEGNRFIVNPSFSAMKEFLKEEL